MNYKFRGDSGNICCPKTTHLQSRRDLSRQNETGKILKYERGPKEKRVRRQQDQTRDKANHAGRVFKSRVKGHIRGKEERISHLFRLGKMVNNHARGARGQTAERIKWREGGSQSKRRQDSQEIPWGQSRGSVRKKKGEINPCGAIASQKKRTWEKGVGWSTTRKKDSRE